VAAFHPTEPGSLEFHVSLERLDDTLAEPARQEAQQASVDAAREVLRADAARHAYVLVSERERQAVELKRRALGKARGGVRRVRRLLP
jgi:hypothetical protein